MARVTTSQERLITILFPFLSIIMLLLFSFIVALIEAIIFEDSTPLVITTSSHSASMPTFAVNSKSLKSASNITQQQKVVAMLPIKSL